MTGQIVLRSAVKIKGLSSWSGEKVAPPTAAGDRSPIQSLPSSSWSFQWIRSFGETAVTLRAELDSRRCSKFPEVEVRKVLRRNLPVESVLERADHAQMIVVGSRGHGGFVGLLLGSVSQGLLHRDRPCPLAVVHAERSES